MVEFGDFLVEEFLVEGFWECDGEGEAVVDSERDD